MYRPFNYSEKMAISKFWLDLFGDIVGVKEGLVALQSLLTIKKASSPFSFKSNELFLMLLQQKKAISKFISWYISGKYEGGNYPPSDHSDS